MRAKCDAYPIASFRTARQIAFPDKDEQDEVKRPKMEKTSFASDDTP